MGQVSSVSQREPQDLVPWVDHGRQCRGVGRRPRMRLDIGVFRSEQRLDAVPRQVLGHVDVFAAAVVAAARVAFGVFIGQHRALRLKDRTGREVLRGDHFQGVALTAELGGQHRGDLRVHFGQRLVGDGMWCAHEIFSCCGNGLRKGHPGDRRHCGDPRAQARDPFGSCCCRSLVVIHQRQSRRLSCYWMESASAVFRSCRDVAGPPNVRRALAMANTSTTSCASAPNKAGRAPVAA